MRRLPRFRMKPLSRTLSRSMHAIWSFLITPSNPVECQASTLRRRRRNIPHFLRTTDKTEPDRGADALRRFDCHVWKRGSVLYVSYFYSLSELGFLRAL